MHCSTEEGDAGVAGPNLQFGTVDPTIISANQYSTAQAVAVPPVHPYLVRPHASWHTAKSLVQSCVSHLQRVITQAATQHAPERVLICRGRDAVIRDSSPSCRNSRSMSRRRRGQSR